MPATAVPYRAPRSRRRSSTEFAVPVAPDELRRRTEVVPHADPRFRLVSVDDDGAVLARRVNWATWGDRFALQWTAHETGSTLRITATKRFTTALGDYGQGTRDLAALAALLGTDDR